MAALHDIDMSSRRSCLEGFAASMGESPPRAPIPEWWTAFEAWYVANKGSRIRVFARTEAFGYEDDEPEVEPIPTFGIEDNEEPDSNDEPDEENGPTESEIDELEIERQQEEI